jgi:lysophospholipase L1-like esterase
MKLRDCRAVFVLLTLLSVSSVFAAEGKYENDIKGFEAADRTQPPPKDGVLFIGSSTFRIWKTMPEDFPGLAVINRGFGGSQIEDSTRYADRIVIPYHPRRIVMYAGDNDLAAKKTPEQVLAEFQDFVKKVRGALPDVPISFISIKPSIARWKLIEQIKEANRLIEQYTKSEKNIDFIDIFPVMLGPDGKPRKELFRPDGLHMNADGYALWIPILRARIEK